MEPWKEALLWIFPRIPVTRFDLPVIAASWDTKDAKKFLVGESIYGATMGFEAAMQSIQTGKWPALSKASRFYFRVACDHAIWKQRLTCPRKGSRDKAPLPFKLTTKDQQILRISVIDEWKNNEAAFWVEENFQQEIDPS